MHYDDYPIGALPPTLEQTSKTQEVLDRIRAFITERNIKPVFIMPGDHQPPVYDLMISTPVVSDETFKRIIHGNKSRPRTAEGHPSGPHFVDGRTQLRWTADPEGPDSNDGDPPR